MYTCLYTHYIALPPTHKYIYSLAMGIVEVNNMSQQHYESRIMSAWYAYDGPMSFEQFYATYIPA